MKEDSARVVRRSSGNSGEPAIQVICLVGHSVLVVFVDVARGILIYASDVANRAGRQADVPSRSRG